MISLTTLALLLLASGPAPAAPADSIVVEFRRQLETQPGSLDLWLSLSQRQEQLGKLDQALVSAQKALDIADGYHTRLRLGWLLLSADRCPEALVHYRAAGIHSPESEDPLLGQQACQIKQENLPSARALGDRLLQLNPDNLWGMKRQAYALFMLGQFEPAAALYHRVLRQTPDDAEMLLGLGWCHQRLGQLDDGRRQCRLAAEQLKDDPRVVACLESTEPPGLIVAGSLHAGVLAYSGSNSHESLSSLSLATALAFPNGVELTAGLLLIWDAARDSTEEYRQSNPVLALTYTDEAWRWKGVFTYLVADDSSLPGTPVISGMMRRFGKVADFDLELNSSWYRGLTAVQIAPGLRWHLAHRVDLFLGGEVIGLSTRSPATMPGQRGSSSLNLNWYASGRMGLAWQVFESWQLHAGAFYGQRRFAVDDEGWSVWNNDDRFFLGYQLGTIVNLGRHWSLYAEFRHLFGDQQEGEDVDFTLLGGILGLRTWY